MWGGAIFPALLQPSRPDWQVPVLTFSIYLASLLLHPVQSSCPGRCSSKAALHNPCNTWQVALARTSVPPKQLLAQGGVPALPTSTPAMVTWALQPATPGANPTPSTLVTGGHTKPHSQPQQGLSPPTSMPVAAAAGPLSQSYTPVHLQ